MKKIMILTFCTVLFTNEALALSESQEYVKQIAAEVGENNCYDGMCFAQTLQAITWQESSFGVNRIGDYMGTQYYYKHNDTIIPIDESELFVEDGIRYTWYQPIKNKYQKRVYKTEDYKDLIESSLGAFQIKPSTARYVIEKQGLKQYQPISQDDEILVNRLLGDTKFSAEIAVNYLIMNYKRAQKLGMNPWKYAVSKYNGGSNNITYINKIRNKIDSLGEL